ncbi:carbohydrate ABC transporter permease [Vallitalea guaymasensis]|uniref:carbohydrate ABC transporter permease n=1 Tax=Vallitalea guaymasensis TaxID=1185412 RepID=UPI00235253E0|nr:carbohydrate ABC transporter permease [Vallitalea guaymasensis]
MVVNESYGEKIFKYFNIIFLGILGLIMLLPIITVTATSFSSALAVDAGKVSLWPVDFTLASWREILAKSEMWRAFFLNIFVTVVGTFLALMTTSLMAYPMAKKEFKPAKILSIMVVITMVFKAPIIPYFLALKNMGLYNNIFVLIVPHLVVPYNLIIMRTFFKQIPLELEEAAKVEGSNYFQILFKIILPMSKASLATVGLFYAVMIWNQFMHPMLFIQDEALFPLQLRLRQYISVGEDLSSGLYGGIKPFNERTLKAATVIFTVVPILCVYPFLQKYFVKGAMLGSVKG